MSLKSNNPIVLVVDDSPDSLGMINSALNTAGYTVLVSLNAEQALNITEQIEPDVVLMDAVMPEVDGFECCQRMRQTLPLTPIIFMTGLTEVEHTVKAFESGGNDYITKPVKPEELLARIASHIHNAKMINNARTALDTAKQFVVAVNNNGEILWSTPEAQELIQINGLEYIFSNKRINELSYEKFKNKLKTWIDEDDKRSDLILEGSEKALTIRYFKLVNNNEHLLRIVEHETMMDSGILQASLPITKREAEVLLWIAHGKTNREIAQILSLSPRTINKHLEQLYPKIEVDNRTSAASIALQTLLGAQA